MNEIKNIYIPPCPPLPKHENSRFSSRRFMDLSICYDYVEEFIKDSPLLLIDNRVFIPETVRTDTNEIWKNKFGKYFYFNTHNNLKI